MDNWKPAAIAAILVGILGVLAGVVLGGDGGGETTTTTVVQPAEATTTDEATTTTTDSTTEDTTTEDTTTTEGSSATGTIPVVDAFDENQLSSNQGDAVQKCIEPIFGSTGAISGLDGEQPTDATVLEILYSDRIYCEAWRLELPVSEYTNLEIGGIGWADGVPAEATAEFSIYGNTIGSDPLFTDTMTGPGDSADAVSLDLADIETVIFVWKPGPPLRGTDGSDNVRYRFLLDGAYLS